MGIVWCDACAGRAKSVGEDVVGGGAVGRACWCGIASRDCRCAVEGFVERSAAAAFPWDAGQVRILSGRIGFMVVV